MRLSTSTPVAAASAAPDHLHHRPIQVRRIEVVGGQAGTASAIAVGSTVIPSTGTPVILASMRRGSGNLGLIAFHLDAGDVSRLGALPRIGDCANHANTDVTGTALVSLGPGRMLSASRINGDLRLTTYSVSDAAAKLAPATILEIQYENPTLPSDTARAWAASGGDEFPRDDVDREWSQVLAPADEYDESALVGSSGWVIAPNDSNADNPFDHPFGFDWEFGLALDDDENRYTALLSPVSVCDGDRIPYANDLGLLAPRGLLGVEWDKGLLPQSFRARVNHGDRVAVFGRWILDKGHSFDGFWRTEFHPPLLMATGSVQQNGDGSEATRVLFMSRPYLPGQTYTLSLDDVYYDAAPDDGNLRHHLINELAKVLLLESTMIEAHPKIKSYPFRGAHRLHFIVRPPSPPSDSSQYRLAVSFEFTARVGCQVEVASTSADHVDVFVTLNSAEYVPPHLPNRKGRTYNVGELNRLQEGSGIYIVGVEALTDAVAALVPGIGWPFLSIYVQSILLRGVRTDEYDALEEINITDSANAVLNVPADSIPAGTGITNDNEQPYPVYGWLEAKWVPRRGHQPALTTSNVNLWLEAVLADPPRARRLKENWLQLLLSEFAATNRQVESLSLVPPNHARELQKAIAMVVDHGGTIRLERRSERSPGSLIVKPWEPRAQGTTLPAQVFYCHFDANFRNWQCGWGLTRGEGAPRS